MKNKKSFFIISIFFILFTSLGTVLVYLDITYSVEKSDIIKKQLFVSLTKMPDLALYSEDSFMRNRSLNGFGDIHSLSPSLLESSKASYAISLKKDL